MDLDSSSYDSSGYHSKFSPPRVDTQPRNLPQIPNYTVKEILGNGAFGIVYKAFKNGVYYAIKEVPRFTKDRIDQTAEVKKEAHSYVFNLQER